MDITLEVNILSKKAKEEAYAGNFKKSMKLFEEAYKLLPSEKLKRRIAKMKEMIASERNDDDENSENDDNNSMIDLGENFFLHQSIANQLYSYQKEGVLWFWRLFNKKQGGILGDDMGLGKTIQVIAFLAGMFDAELVHRILIVAPVAVLVNWEKELNKWAGGIRVKTFHGSSKNSRLKNLHSIQKSEGVLLTTYGMIVSNLKSFCQDQNEEDFIWDYIILDEGHKIKNPCKTSKYIRLVPAKFHYILTGTPIQNNLSEMWALFDFTQQGTLLGTEKTFKVEFENPIVKAREKDATSYQQEYGNKLSTRLREIIAPYFLRRTKEEVFKKGSVKQVEAEKILNKLETTKFDLVVWVYLTELQQKLYRGFIQSERVKQTLMSTQSPLAELQLLKKISDHPRLQSTLSKLLTNSEERETRLTIGIDESDNDLEDEEDKVIEIVDDLPIENLIKDSGKMVFLVYLMENLRAENHRTVIFSQSRKMLDIIQRVLSGLGHKLLRIDGKMRNPQDREKVLQKFKEDLSFNILLMTTQVGSVGITLTCADRLVIFDPSWNPGTDAQAVDRVYRIGQEKDVIVYRLITCGSIEEKIYRKQIFKNAIMKQTTGASENPYRYFTNLELRELFSLDNPRISTTQLQLQEMHPYLSNSENREFERHLEFLNNPYIFGVSHHGMLFSHDAINDITNHEMEDDLQAQVLAAANLISKEFNETEIKLPQRKVQTKRSEYSDSEQLDKNFSEAKHSCTSNFLLNKSINDLECNRDDLCKKILNLSIDHSEDALKSSEETSIAKSPSSFLSNSNRSLQIDNITSDIQKMVIKANEVDDIHVKEPVDAYGRKLESVSMPSNYEHLDQNGESLQESSEVANDTDLQISVSHNHYSITKSAETLDCNSSYETVENYSVYEAVDNGCSPISITALNERATPNGKHSELMNEKTNLKEVNYSTVSDEKQASQSYDSIVEQSLTSHDGKEGILLNEIDSELKTSEDDSNLSASIVLNPSQGYKANATGYNPILAPEVSSVIRNLGKLYRTPPVSPMIKKSLLDVSLDNFVNQETSNLATNNMATSTPICAKEHNDFIPNSFNSLKVGKPNITDYIKNKCELIDEDLQNIVAPTLNGCEADHLVSLTELTSEETDSAEKCSQNNIPCSQINNLEKRDKRTEIKRTEDKRTDLVEFSNATSPPKNIFLNSIDLDFLEFGIPSKKVISETNGLIESERSVYFDKESPKSFNVDKGVKIQNIKQPHLKTSRNLISSDTLAGNSEMQYADTLPVNSLCSHDKLKDPTKLLDDDLIQYADTLPVRVSSVVTCVKDNNNYVDTSPLSVSSKFEKTRSSNNKIDLSPTPDYLISDDSSSFDFERSKNSKSLIDKVKSSEFSESSQESVFDFTKNNSTNIDCNRNMTTAIDLEYDDSVQRSELLLLTDLLTQNMGNVNIDDHVLIKIVDLVKKLQLDVQ